MPIHSDEYLETTYTIRRPGCTAWATRVPAHRLADELAIANGRVRGHVVVAESGALEGQVVDPGRVSDIARRTQR